MNTKQPASHSLGPVRIRSIRSAALVGESPKGGWSAESRR